MYSFRLTAPVITGTTSYRVGMSILKDIDYFKSNLTVTDNYNTGLALADDSNIYTTNFNKVGNYSEK